MVDTQIGTLGYDALDIADYIIRYEDEHGHCINNLKLQKILYFLQAQFVVGYGKALFSDAIIAWDWGPVVEKVYYAYNIYAGASIFINKAHYRNAYIEREHKATIDEMLEQIRPYSSTQLVNICHNQTPWKNARNRWNKTISLVEMREFFNEDSPRKEEKMESINIKGLTFVKTHESHPERYDVRNEKFERVAYVKLDRGYLTCEIKESNELIYEEELDDTQRQSSFANDEQLMFCLTNIANTILETLEEKRIATESHQSGKIYNLHLEFGARGYLLDGREYCITSIPSIVVQSDGTMRYGDISLQIDGIHYTMRISEFVENVKTIGNLRVR